MDFDLLTNLLTALDRPQARFAELDRYYAGRQALAFLSPESRKALGNRLDRMVSNIPRLAVTSLAERLRVTGFTGDQSIWADWLANDLDQLSEVAHREALLLGASYASVWADPQGNPRVSIESARQVSVLADPGSRETVAALKRWQTTGTTEATLYLPDSVIRLRADSPGAVSTAFRVVNEMDNPLGVVPVVQLRNSDLLAVGGFDYPEQLLDYGWSEIHDLMPLVDGINKLLSDMLVTAEFNARPRRWVTGMELVDRPKLDENGQPVLDGNGDPVIEAVNPIPDGDRMMIGEDAAIKFGQLAGASLDGYENAVNVLLGQIMAVSALPAHYVGIFTDNPTSADATRASEASLTARAEARQQCFSKPWEQVARLMGAIRNGVDPAQVEARVQWCSAATRSIAQESDAVTKLFAAGLISRSGALRKLGYSEDQIAAEMAAIAADRDAATDPILKQYHQSILGADDERNNAA